MNITQENIDELNAVLKVKVVADDYLPKVETVLKDYQKKATIPGFRPGKVPVGMIKKMYGKSVLVDEINKLLNDSLHKYLNDNKIEVLGNPLPKTDTIVDWDNQKEFEFFYEMGLAPKFNVDFATTEKFIYKVLKVDEKLVDKFVSDIAKRYGKNENMEVSGEGDWLNGDIVELDSNAEILPGGIFRTSSLFIEEIKDVDIKNTLIGLREGDKVILDVKHLFDNSKDIAHMLGVSEEVAEKFTSKIQFTVKNIIYKSPSEINQELFDKLYGPGTVNSEDEFRKKIKEELATVYSHDSERMFYNDVVEHLMNTINFNLPTEFLKRWIVAVNEKSITPEQLEAEFDGYSKGLKWQLIENKIIRDNNIQIRNEDMVDYTKQMITEQFSRYSPTPMGDEELDKMVQRILSSKEEAKKIYEKLCGKEVLTLFKTKLTLEEKEVPFDEFLKTAK